MIRYHIEYTYTYGNGQSRIGDGDFRARQAIISQDDLDELAHVVEVVTGRTGVAIYRYTMLTTRIESDFV